MTISPPQAALLRDLLPEGRYAQQDCGIARIARIGSTTEANVPRRSRTITALQLHERGLVSVHITEIFRHRIFTVTPAGREYARLNFPEVTP